MTRKRKGTNKADKSQDKLTESSVSPENSNNSNNSSVLHENTIATLKESAIDIIRTKQSNTNEENTEIQKTKKTHRGRKHKNQNETKNEVINVKKDVNSDNITPISKHFENVESKNYSLQTNEHKMTRNTLKSKHAIANNEINLDSASKNINEFTHDAEAHTIEEKCASCKNVEKKYEKYNSLNKSIDTTVNNVESSVQDPSESMTSDGFQYPKSRHKHNRTRNTQETKQIIPATPVKTDDVFDEEDTDDEMEDCIEYKITPRPVFVANSCNLCKTLESNSVKLTPCLHCKMVSYCSENHRNADLLHPQLCSAVCDIRDQRGTQHVYQNSNQLNFEEFRCLRIHIVTLCQHACRRQLEPFEREILLFPRLCYEPKCREWRHEKLMNCPECKQVSYCISHPEHLSMDHVAWCKSFKLFHAIVLRNHEKGRIDPILPTRVFSEKYQLPDKMDDFFRDIFVDENALADDCNLAILSLMATAPLTTLYAMQRINFKCISDTLTIHIVGAELQFEADTLNKWEVFFLHIVPDINNLKIIFIGPELNVENLPVELLSKIRMCSSCQSANRVVTFEFQCRKLYHQFAASKLFVSPDIICAFNPGLHRKTGYAGQDTWPETISAIMKLNVPFISTAYTEHEAPLDLQRVIESAGRNVQILVPPQINPYASHKPDRNFISEESAPLIFKNFYLTIVN